jgi:tryptophan synthase alpha chain
VDGTIVPDVPFEEKGEILGACQKYGVDLISLIAPTSDDRIQMIAKEAQGYIYIVSSLGVTGVRREITTDIGAMVEKIREVSQVPCAVGFGIATPEQATKMATLSDGAIVGSAIVKLCAQYGRECVEPVKTYVSQMVKAVESCAG